MCCGEEGSERTPPSHLTILHVQSVQLCVCGGRRVVVHVMANRRLHSKRKKRKALATHHLFFTNQIIYRRRGARISGKSLQGFNYENSTSSAEVLTKHHLPLLSPRLPSSVTAAATGISRTDHGAFTVRKLQPPPSRNPRSDSWSRFSWGNVWLGVYEKHNMII